MMSDTSELPVLSFTNRTVMEIALKLLGLSMLFRATLAFVSAGGVFFTPGIGGIRATIVVQIVTFAVLAVGLLRWSALISRLILREERPLPRVTDGPTPAWYQMAFALAGLWLLLYRLPLLLLQIYFSYGAVGSMSLVPDRNGVVGEAVALLILGLVLVLANRRLAQWLYVLHRQDFAPVEGDPHV